MHIIPLSASPNDQYNHARSLQESSLVAQAGMRGRITVATNMAGRGTDILLGGDPAHLCGLVLAEPYNQHFVDVYSESADAGGARTGSAEGAAVAEVMVRAIYFGTIR